LAENQADCALARWSDIETDNTDAGRPVVWFHPAFADRRIYARNDHEIICLDLPNK
jgi:hypothetical protein